MDDPSDLFSEDDRRRAYEQATVEAEMRGIDPDDPAAMGRLVQEALTRQLIGRHGHFEGLVGTAPGTGEVETYHVNTKVCGPETLAEVIADRRASNRLNDAGRLLALGRERFGDDFHA